MTDSQRARQSYAASNRQAAGIIMADIGKYGGEGSLAVIWARSIAAKQMRRIDGPLFTATAQRYGRRAA